MEPVKWERKTQKSIPVAARQPEVIRLKAWLRRQELDHLESKKHVKWVMKKIASDLSITPESNDSDVSQPTGKMAQSETGIDTIKAVLQ